MAISDERKASDNALRRMMIRMAFPRRLGGDLSDSRPAALARWDDRLETFDAITVLEYIGPSGGMDGEAPGTGENRSAVSLPARLPGWVSAGRDLHGMPLRSPQFDRPTGSAPSARP
jgi:hypothetical protein